MAFLLAVAVAGAATIPTAIPAAIPTAIIPTAIPTAIPTTIPSPSVVHPTHQRGRVPAGRARTPVPDTIVLFFSTRCRFCVDMKAIVRKALRIVGREQVRFVEVNVDSDQSLAENYNVSGVPTLVYVSGKTGKVLDRMQGGGKSLNAVVDFMYGPSDARSDT